MRTTINVHLHDAYSDGQPSVEGYVLEDHGVASVSAQAEGTRLVLFSDADNLEILGRKCLEIADELRAFTAAKDDVAA